MLPRVTKALGVRPAPGPCAHKVRVSEGDTVTKRRRIVETGVAGIPLDQCGLKAIYLVDDVPMCQSHAGQVAIKLLMGRDDD